MSRPRCGVVPGSSASTPGLRLSQRLLALSALQASTRSDRGTPLAILRHLAKRASLKY
jgi:hypothetical protein